MAWSDDPVMDAERYDQYLAEENYKKENHTYEKMCVYEDIEYDRYRDANC